jgi:hypothetical protein
MSTALVLLVLHLSLAALASPTLAQDSARPFSAPALDEPASAPVVAAPTFFKSGVKYDPKSHQWRDLYSSKPINLGLPGVSDRYGAQNVVASNDLVAANAGPGTGSGSTGNSWFTFNHVVIFSLLGVGIATAIVVPVCLGVSRHHHHLHHQQDVWQRNNAAGYFFFHNQTLPVPKLILPPPPHEHGSPKPPPGN